MLEWLELNLCLLTQKNHVYKKDFNCYKKKKKSKDSTLKNCIGRSTPHANNLLCMLILNEPF